MATHCSVLAWRIPGTGSLVGCRLWGRTEMDMTEATQQQQKQQQNYAIIHFKCKYLLYSQIYEEIFIKHIHHAIMILPTIIIIAQKHKEKEDSEK